MNIKNLPHCRKTGIADTFFKKQAPLSRKVTVRQVADYPFQGS